MSSLDYPDVMGRGPFSRMDELTIMQIGDVVAPIKKECALSAKGHICRQTLVERREYLGAERAGSCPAIRNH